MSIIDFNELAEMEKVKKICRDAVEIGRRSDGCFRILLLQLDNFYIEIYFHYNQGCIKRIRAFTNPAELEDYLQQIDISAIVGAL